MLLSLIIGLLIVILVVSIFIGYRKNKTKRDILLSQKKEIEINLEELKQLNIKLQEADQYKSIFLASMSHELRTPLNSIIGYTGILLMGMTGTMNDEQNKQLNKVKNNAKHLLNLINDILDISKIEADRVEIHSEEFNIKSLITEVCDTIHPKILEKQLELTVQIPDDLIVNTDMRRIKQVVLNLVSNAVNYTDSGSIHIQAARLPENKFKLSVRDTGIGISEAEIARLFQPFQQIDSTLTKKNKGTGLGLYLCRKLVTLLKGEIFVNSKTGVGSEFFIVMPLEIKK
jgi:signal transduction histidine kinase